MDNPNLAVPPPVAVPQWDPNPQTKYLPHISYSRYIKDGNNVYPEVVAHDSGVPLEVFKNLHQLVITRDYKSVEGDCLVLPGELEVNKSYPVTSEITKKVARSMLKAVRINQMEMSFFTPFDSTNIRVSKAGEVTFTGVRLITPARHLPDGPVPDVWTLHCGTKQNIMAVHDIIKNHLFNGVPPKEIQDLLDLMRCDCFRGLYHIHGSLVPLATYSGVFKEIYDQIRHKLPKAQMREILKHMPYVEEWKKSLRTNHLLMLTFGYNEKSYQVPLKTNAKQNRLNLDQQAALKSLGLTEEKGQSELTPEQMMLLNALHFLDYLRNRTSHQMEAYQKWIESGMLDFTAQGADLIALVRFTRVLGYLMVRLQMIGRLSELSIESHF